MKPHCEERLQNYFRGTAIHATQQSRRPLDVHPDRRLPRRVDNHHFVDGLHTHSLPRRQAGSQNRFDYFF
jgi:hypothetical protein